MVLHYKGNLITWDNTAGVWRLNDRAPFVTLKMLTNYVDNSELKG